MSLVVDIKKKIGSFSLDVSFETQNEIVAILGASGCGKSMTLKCIAGIEKSDSGRIVLDGRVLYDSEKGICLPPQKRKVGYLFQNYALFPNMTVRGNIFCGMHNQKDRQEKEKKLKALLALLKLEGLEDRKPAELSGGQQQRTAIARILASEPEILMLDEPFSALDAHLRDSLKIELRDLLRTYGKTVLLVTHSRDEAYNMSVKLGIMADGRMQGTREVKSVFADPETIQAAVITGCKNIAAARRIGPFEAEVPEWGITLRTSRELKEGLAAIGIRAHYFRPGNGRSGSEEENTRSQGTPELRTRQGNFFPVTFAGEMEEPFETILQFRYTGQAEGSPSIWWRLPKDKKPREFPTEIGIAPVNVLPLYE